MMPDVLSNFQMLSRHRQRPLAKVVLGVQAIALGLVAQLLMFGLEMTIELSQFPFPASILAMVLLFLFLLVLGWVWHGFGGIYINHLQQPVSSVLMFSHPLPGPVGYMSRIILTNNGRRRTS